MTKKSMQSPTLDFVITWVDGSDPAWLDEKSHFASGYRLPVVKPITGKNATATGII